MLDRLRSMEVFIAAAAAGSFAAAAVQLGMSAQMVARHVQTLEDRLQVRLINRTTRKQSLTETGHLYVRVASRLQVNDAVAQLNAARAGVGILLGAEDLVRSSLDSGELVQIFPEYSAPSKPMHLIYPADKQRSVKLQRFIDEAMREFNTSVTR